MTNEEVIRILGRMLDEFCNEDSYAPECKDAVEMAIEALKAQSKHDQNTMSKQQDLETLGIKTGETCEDAISRQDAINAILADKIVGEALIVMNALGDGRLALTLNNACDRHIRAIEQLPSAQPERKKGLWKVIRYNGDMQRYARCKCGYEYGAGKFDGLKFVALKLHNFCPNCGAKMEVEE